MNTPARRLKICVYGGTDRQGMPVAFVEHLAYELLRAMPAVIVTGGFKSSRRHPDAISTDYAALTGSERFAAEHGADLRALYEAWVPEPSLDDRRRDRGAIRIGEQDGVTPRVVRGATPLGRRLAMVRDVDVVIAISGGRHTEVVIEQAIEVGLPTITLPFGAGVAETLYEQHRARLVEGFPDGELERAVASASALVADDPRRAAQVVVELVQRARIGTCLALMPFDDEHLRRSDDVLAPTVAEHMRMVRLDLLPDSRSIERNLREAMAHALAIIADVTELNHNVMYEIGVAVGMGRDVFVYLRDAARLAELPIYFRTINVHTPADDDEFRRMLGAYLERSKQRRLSGTS